MFKIQSKKDVKKICRSLLEICILLLLVGIMIRALFVFRVYEPYEQEDKAVVSGEDKGFLAISYQGVDRIGSDTLIATERLEEHLKALYDNGYVTVTQEDIKNYYEKGIPLPDKALYLMYEDGRRDTAIFAQKIMEQYNYKGTVLTYAEKFDGKDSKFLTAKDLKGLEESGFWEMGSNGYRLSYINVFDRYGRFLGELSSAEFSAVARYLSRDYNQYLMDFIRDENGIPVESYDMMKNRIGREYDMMKDAYMQKLGAVPDVYVLIHANMGQLANNKKVSAVNEECMIRLFDMNFNREGNCLNSRESGLYDLTRMQPQAYWYTNHLLMRIRDDLPQEEQEKIVFVDGERERKAAWETLSGAAEFDGDVIALTSVPDGDGLLRLKESEEYGDVSVLATLTGNKLGTQTIYLRGDEALGRYVAVTLQNNRLYVKENNGTEKESVLFELDLDEFDGVVPRSIEEDQKAALNAEYKALAKGAESVGETSEDIRRQWEETQGDIPKTVEEGAKPYELPLQIREAGNRAVEISLKGDSISVRIDGKAAAENLKTRVTDNGFLFLESAWAEYGCSQRNIADDVYDGVFEQICVKDLTGENRKEAPILYENRLTGMEWVKNRIKETGNTVVNWFIKNL